MILHFVLVVTLSVCMMHAVDGTIPLVTLDNRDHESERHHDPDYGCLCFYTYYDGFLSWHRGWEMRLGLVGDTQS